MRIVLFIISQSRDDDLATFAQAHSLTNRPGAYCIENGARCNNTHTPTLLVTFDIYHVCV
jgi:hypothetical protein